MLDALVVAMLALTPITLVVASSGIVDSKPKLVAGSWNSEGSWSQLGMWKLSIALLMS